jgi:hypothetical protein
MAQYCHVPQVNYYLCQTLSNLIILYSTIQSTYAELSVFSQIL